MFRCLGIPKPKLEPTCGKSLKENWASTKRLIQKHFTDKTMKSPMEISNIYLVEQPDDFRMAKKLNCLMSVHLRVEFVFPGLLLPITAGLQNTIRMLYNDFTRKEKLLTKLTAIISA